MADHHTLNISGTVDSYSDEDQSGILHPQLHGQLHQIEYQLIKLLVIRTNYVHLEKDKSTT